MSARSGQRASVTADELNSGEDAAVEAAIRVHEWVQNELQRLANAIGDLERCPSTHAEDHADMPSLEL